MATGDVVMDNDTPRMASDPETTSLSDEERGPADDLEERNGVEPLSASEETLPAAISYLTTSESDSAAIESSDEPHASPEAARFEIDIIEPNESIEPVRAETLAEQSDALVEPESATDNALHDVPEAAHQSERLETPDADSALSTVLESDAAPSSPPSDPPFVEPSIEEAIPDFDIPGLEWATIDADGNVRQRDGDLYTGRVIGRITGHNPALALGFYAREFDQFSESATTLEDEARAASNPAAFFGRIRRTLEQIPTIDGIGDFDGLIRRLHGLERDLRVELDRRSTAKERLATRAEELATSTEWKAAGDELRAMFDEWKGVGSLGRDREQALWERFNTARQAFYTHREVYFAERNRERQANHETKEELCVRAEALQDSTDWKTTSDALKGLQAEWKATGTAGREVDQALWQRFRGAMDLFFQARAARYETNKQVKHDLCAAAEALQESTDWDGASITLRGLQEQWKQAGFAGGAEDDALWARFRRALDRFYSRRAEVFAERDRLLADNLHQKEALIVEVEALLAGGDPRSGVQRVKILQEQWKSIGPVPRDRAEPVWQRFRAACDALFNGVREERERRQTLWRSNLKESLERQRAFAKDLMDAIARDDEMLDRWKSQLETLRPGGREPEIRQDLESRIASGEARIQQKQTRFEEILASIAELEGRLAMETSR